MNIKTAYLSLGAVIVVAVVVFLLLSPDEEQQEQAANFPPGHPDVGQMQQGKSGSDQPGKANVRMEFLEHLNALKAKVDSAPADDTTGVLALARLLMDAHQPSESVRYFERYLKVYPKDIPALLDFSVVQYNLGNKEKSLEVTQRILKIDSKSTIALYNLGALHASMDKKADAKRVWQDLMKRFPDSPDADRAKAALADL